jgi:ketosteroid isomerase-like protein
MKYSQICLTKRAAVPIGISRLWLAGTMLAIASMGMHANAQDQKPQESVKAAVESLFNAMRNADSAGVMAAFAPGAVLQGVGPDAQGKTVVRTTEIGRFASAVGRQARDAFDERVSFSQISIDDALASVWTPYQFYLKGQFSHCGVNAFHLVRMDNGAWKIQHLIDTRRKEGCQ